MKLRAFIATLLSLLPFTVLAQPTYPPPPAPKDPSHLGENIQRTMTLLATSTPTRRNHVRILFYGQSITEQSWSKSVADDLRRRFPHADLEIENRAIGGFSAQRLILPAEHDLYPFYPDLVIFHVYGANQQYEEIIKSIRTRTTAEVLIQRDHLTKWPPETIDRDKDKSAWWDNFMNEQFLPATARKYACGLADVRAGWITYLKTNHLEPKALLKDTVHLNDHGNYLMAELIKQNLVYRPDLPNDAWKDLVRTIDDPAALKWDNDTLTLSFEGNRIDLTPAAAPTGATQVLIDGKRPSEFPGCYRITRPAPGPWSPLFVSRVDHDAPLILEDWTLTVTHVADDGKSFQYEVRGSVTGPDGAGSSDQPFTSTSRRVKLDPAAFFRGTNPKLPVGYTSKWQVLPMFTDTLDSTTPFGKPITVAQGLPNTKHTLQLKGALPLYYVRYCKPPLPDPK